MKQIFGFSTPKMRVKPKITSINTINTLVTKGMEVNQIFVFVIILGSVEMFDMGLDFGRKQKRKESRWETKIPAIMI
jgi:hypothetical protein